MQSDSPKHPPADARNKSQESRPADSPDWLNVVLVTKIKIVAAYSHSDMIHADWKIKTGK